jgi:hypothetical protein
MTTDRTTPAVTCECGHDTSEDGPTPLSAGERVCPMCYHVLAPLAAPGAAAGPTRELTPREVIAEDYIARLERSLDASNVKLAALRTAVADAEARVAKYVEDEAACCPEDVGFPEYIAALEARVAAAEARERANAEDAERWRFIAPHLVLDGEVDDLDYATTQYNHLQFKDESLPLVNGFWFGAVNRAVDATIRAALATPTGA